jgi:AraC family transcriptional regulator
VDALDVQPLFETPTVQLHDVCCPGLPVEPTEDECTSDLRLVFPYRGVFVRHVGDDQAVAEPSQILFFNAGEAYRISHPVPGGDACLSIGISEALLRELTPAALLRGGGGFVFRQQRLRIDPRAQALVALLRHGTQRHVAETLEAESLTLTLVMRALGPRTTHTPASTPARRRLADRVKVLLASDLARRWTLADIAAEVGHSPVYLTQVFQQVEGLPLYRYQLRMRLARALDLLGRYDDLTTLGLDLGFSSHSHFTSAFTQAYGRSPSEFRQAVLRRGC